MNNFDDIHAAIENYKSSDALSHHGIKGQKWGLRRYQNADGTLTQEGKERYYGHYGSRHRVFISGSSKTQTEDSPYYRKELPDFIKQEIDRYIKRGDNIIVGDAPGIDRQVQDYLNALEYENVDVYGPGHQLRYVANNKWVQRPIPADEYEEGSKEWLAKKDKVMQKAATEGLAIVLENGGAGATRNNVSALESQGKNVSVFELSSNPQKDIWLQKYNTIDSVEKIKDQLRTIRNRNKE